MTQILSRRRLLSLSAAGGAGLLGACTLIHAGSSTTATLDVARVVTDSKAILAALSAALLVGSLVTALGPNYAVVQAMLLSAQGTLSEIETLTGGSVTVIVNTAKLQTLVISLLGDVQTALALVQSAVATMTGTVAATAGAYIAAILSLIPFVQTAAGLMTATSLPGPLSEAQALAIAHGTGR